MESKSPFNLEDPHKKAQDAIDHAREVREKKIADCQKTLAEPHVITDGKLKRCSACGYQFPADVHPSMSVAFADHLLKAHKTGAPVG